MGVNTDKNIAIAQFMGYEYLGWNDPRHRCTDYTSGYWGMKDQARHSFKLPGSSMMFNPLTYHKDWNKLMEVVDKIEELGYCARIFKNFLSVHNIDKGRYGCTIAEHENIPDDQILPSCISKGYGDTRKDAVYKAIIDFISKQS